MIFPPGVFQRPLVDRYNLLIRFSEYVAFGALVQQGSGPCSWLSPAYVQGCTDRAPCHPDIVFPQWKILNHLGCSPEILRITPHVLY